MAPDTGVARRRPLRVIAWHSLDSQRSQGQLIDSHLIARSEGEGVGEVAVGEVDAVEQQSHAASRVAGGAAAVSRAFADESLRAELVAPSNRG